MKLATISTVVLLMAAVNVQAQNYWIPAEKFDDHSDRAPEGRLVNDSTLGGKKTLILEQDEQVRIILGIDADLQNFVDANPTYEVCALVANISGGRTNTIRVKHHINSKRQDHTLTLNSYKTYCSEKASSNDGDILGGGVKLISPSQSTIKVRGISIRPATAPTVAAPSKPALAATNVGGGGFQSDVTISDDGKTVYSSADVSGISKSTNGGLEYVSRNNGLYSYKVASLAITGDNDQILYAGSGDKGNSGGLFRSEDGGDSWTLIGAGNSAQFAGNHSKSGDPVPSGHPRSNGDLIVVDEGSSRGTYTDDILIAGTYNSGVHVFINGGDRATSVVNRNGFVRSVAGHPTKRRAYAAIRFSNDNLNGIYEINYDNPSNARSSLVYKAKNPEGVTVLSNGHVYAAIGTLGIAKFDGRNWSTQNSGLPSGSKRQLWTAVTGYVLNGEDVVYAGANNDTKSNQANVWRTSNSGGRWSPLINDNLSDVSDTVYGQDYNWWYRIDGWSEAGLGRKHSVVSSIDVARGSNSNWVGDDIVYISGRGGLWKSENGGGNWAPAVKNMQVTANPGVAVNPNNSDQVIIANTDYVVLETGNGFDGRDLFKDKPQNSGSRAYDIMFDERADQAIVGTGNRDKNSEGEVYTKSASILGVNTNWKNTNLKRATNSKNGRVRAVTVGYHDGSRGVGQTILAAVEGEGVYRYTNGRWSRSVGVSIGDTKRSKFVWPDNTRSGTVYLIDLSRGLYRSKDGGRSWTNMWPSLELKNNDFFNTGYIAANDPETLYISIDGKGNSPSINGFGVYRINNANVGNVSSSKVDDITRHSDNVVIERPGPMVMGPDGNLWLTEQQHSARGVEAKLYRMDNPANDSNFSLLDIEGYSSTAVRPSDIDIAKGKYVYISQNGNGIVKISIQ